MAYLRPARGDRPLCGCDGRGIIKRRMMFFGFDLGEIFLFPVRSKEARKQLLIGALVSLAAFIVPIIPYLVLFGYGARIARQVFNNQPPRMVAWDDWGSMLKDGARMFGVRMIYSIPIFIFVIPLLLATFAMPFVLENVNSAEAESIATIFLLVITCAIFLLLPISLPLAVIIPAAEMHTVETEQFSAGFHVRDWWPIFRANVGGFITAFGIYYLAAMGLSFVFQFMMATLVLACLFPILLPLLTIYLTLIMYVTIAQAYKDGKTRLSQKALIHQQA
jgi:hypothetical protein